MRNLNYRPELDGLRAVAVIAVLISHWVPEWAYPVNWGAAGVYLFFVISGFVITRGLLRDMAQRSRISIGDFYKRRAFRIWPIYFLSLAFTFWVWPGMPGRDALWHALFLSNFLSGVEGKFVFPIHYWSLAVEQQFYIFWPLLVALFFRRLSAICWVMLLAAPVSRLYFLTDGNIPASLFALTSNVDSLAVGAVIAIAEARGYSLRSARNAVGLISLMVLAFLCVMAANDQRQWEFVLLATATAGLSMYAIDAAQTTPWLKNSLCCSPLLFLGKISYGVYIYHVLVGMAVSKFQLDQSVTALASAAVTLIVATVSWYTIERPMIAMAHRSLSSRERIDAAR